VSCKDGDGFPSLNGEYVYIFIEGAGSKGLLQDSSVLQFEHTVVVIFEYFFRLSTIRFKTKNDFKYKYAISGIPK
jgi:hypothetical protein